jgi:hypothetical protein
MAIASLVSEDRDSGWPHRSPARSNATRFSFSGRAHPSGRVPTSSADHRSSTREQERRVFAAVAGGEQAGGDRREHIGKALGRARVDRTARSGPAARSRATTSSSNASTRTDRWARSLALRPHPSRWGAGDVSRRPQSQLTDQTGPHRNPRFAAPVYIRPDPNNDIGLERDCVPLRPALAICRVVVSSVSYSPPTERIRLGSFARTPFVAPRDAGGASQSSAREAASPEVPPTLTLAIQREIRIFRRNSARSNFGTIRGNRETGTAL